MVATSSNGCISSNTAVTSVTVNALPVLTVTALKQVLLPGRFYQVYGFRCQHPYTGPAVLPMRLSFTPTASASYSVVTTDLNGCQNAAAAALTVNALPSLSVASSASLLCNGQQAALTASGASSYSRMRWPERLPDYFSFGFRPTTPCWHPMTMAASTPGVLPTVSPCNASLTASYSVRHASCKDTKGWSHWYLNFHHIPQLLHRLRMVPTKHLPETTAETVDSIGKGYYTVKVIFSYHTNQFC